MPREIEVKSILNTKKKRDSWFLDDYTINMYSSCSFNCLYCYIRGSKYGTNLEDSLSVKINALDILERQLFNKSKKRKYGIIVLSSATDPYLQIEKKYELTREALKLIAKYKFPVHIITKSDLIERDFDLLWEINKYSILPKELKQLNGSCIVSFSFSTLDDDVAGIFEPGATKPSKRYETLKKTKLYGFRTGVSLMPLLPYISDTTQHLDKMFTAFKSANIDYILPATITLFGSGKYDSKTLTINAIKKHYPNLIEKYERLFNNNYELPQYYRNAFNNKMKELCSFHRLKNRIFPNE